MNPKELTGKVALVTGASRSAGKANRWPSEAGAAMLPGLRVHARSLAQFSPFVYVQNMTQAVAQILGEFERLSEKE